MTGLHETGIVSGTRDKEYNLIAFVQSCLKNTLRMAVYRGDAERDNDAELVELFTKAQADSRKGAEIGKRLLAERLTTTAAAKPAAEGAAGDAEPPPTDVMAPNRGTPEQPERRESA